MPGRAAADADLSACDDEQIHLLSAIQGAGCLLSVNAEWIIIRASRNAGEFLGLAHDDLLGKQIDDVISPEAMHSVRNRLMLSGGPGTVERLSALPLPGGKLFDVSVHGVGQETVLEIEPGGRDDADAPALLRRMVNRLQAQKSIANMHREAVRQIRALTGFNRVMMYRFGQDGSGEVVAEALDSGLLPYLGLHYPASDIPRQARALYERNWLRIIFDVGARPVPITPEFSQEGERLDLSMSVLRSVSPVHLEYLRNMGVQCSMSISILREGRLWGLIACHNNSRIHLSLETRTVAELFGQMFSYALEVRQRQEDAAYDAHVQDVHNQIATTFSTPDMNLDGLPATLIDLADYIDADGVGICQAEKITLCGITPTAEEFQQLLKHLSKTAPGRVFATSHLAANYPAAANYPIRAAGILCIPVSCAPRIYLVFFRRNIAKIIDWAGQPGKMETAGPNGARLTPRKSFAVWRQIVEDKSAPWFPREMRAAEGLRIMLVEQVLRMTEAAKADQEVADRRSEILIAELNHRIRNILGLVRGVVKQSALSSDSIRTLVENVDDRIRSLARAYDLLTGTAWKPAPLRDLLYAELESFGTVVDRVTFTGPEVSLQSQAFFSMALVVHELATNAAKYGALSLPEGHVEIVLTQDPIGNVKLIWRESGGPVVRTPTRRSFGTTILEQAIPLDLNGEVHLRFPATGFEFEATLPAAVVTCAAPGNTETIALGSKAAAGPPAALDGLLHHCLLVEDNLFIAMDAEDTLRQIGAKHIVIARTVAQALDLVEQEKFTFALLDVNLGNETSLPVARVLRAKNILCALGTGYGDKMVICDALADIPVIAKPYHRAVMLQVLGGLAEKFRGGAEHG